MTRLTEVRNSVIERQRHEKEREARRARRLEEERLLGREAAPPRRKVFGH